MFVAAAPVDTPTTSSLRGDINPTTSFLASHKSIIIVACVTPSVPAGVEPAMIRLISIVSESANRLYAISSSPIVGLSSVPPKRSSLIIPASPAPDAYALPDATSVPALVNEVG